MGKAGVNRYRRASQSSPDELDHSQRLVRLLKDIAISANEASSVEETFEFTLKAVADFTGWKAGHAFVKSMSDEGALQVILGPIDEKYSAVRRATLDGKFDAMIGLPGRVFASGEAEWITDVRDDPRFLRSSFAEKLNVRAGVAFPAFTRNEVVAVLEFFAADPESPDEALLETMTIVGTQLGRVVERERARRIVLDRDRKLLDAQRIGGLGYWEWNPSTGQLSWTDQLYELYGLDPGEGITYEKYLDFMPEEDRKEMLAVIEKAGKDHQPYYHLHRIVRPDGTVRYLQAHGEVDTDQEGRITRMYGTALDVTRLKRAEIGLRLMEERTWALTESAVDAIITVDDRGRIVGWNESATRLFGFERSEVEGKLLTLIMPERYHLAQSVGLKRIVERGEKKLIGKTMETLGRRKSGEEFPIELSLSMWEEGDHRFFGGIVRDISERKRVQQELVDKSEQLRRLAARHQKVREEERTRLSRDVHDSLGQFLTGLRMDVAMLEKAVGVDSGPIHGQLQAIKSGIDETVHVVRRISSDLRPGVLDDVGIDAALEWELSKFERRTGVTCTFDCFTPGRIGMEANQSTALFRVFQELLTNVARHANAQSVHTSFSVEDGQIVLIVEDDGVGIDRRGVSLSKSLGVLGMRERLAPWDGEIEFQGAPGHGTRVVVKVPRIDEKTPVES